MVRVITIMDDIYADLHRMKRERGLSFSGLFRELLSEREKKRDIMAFAGSVCDFEIDRHAIENAKKGSRAWKQLI